jgi:pilus assembly protein CpaB
VGAAPTGAFRSLEEVVGDGRRVALTPILPNEPILAGRISGPGGRATLAGVIRPGMRASTIRVDDVMGVAGFVLPGDFVDVLLTRPDGADREVMRTDLLLQGVRILAVDQLADQAKDSPVVAKAATIEVTPAQAQKLALAGQVGTLALALRSAAEPLATGGAVASAIRTSDLGGAQPRGFAPAAAAPIRIARRAPAPGPSIQIWRGSEASSVAVRRE